jgi:hypothetical protein
MKPYIIILLVVILNFSSCEEKNDDQSFPFEAEVLGINMDCGLPAIKFINNLDQVNEIADTYSPSAIFIAKNLPSELQLYGISIVLNVRKIQNSELGVCSTMGPSYPWIYVLEARRKE